MRPLIPSKCFSFYWLLMANPRPPWFLSFPEITIYCDEVLLFFSFQVRICMEAWLPNFDLGSSGGMPKGNLGKQISFLHRRQKINYQWGCSTLTTLTRKTKNMLVSLLQHTMGPNVRPYTNQFHYQHKRKCPRDFLPQFSDT